MKIKIVLAVSLISIVLAGCGQEASNDEEALKAENIKELVNDYSAGNIKSESASITSQQLMVKKRMGKN